MARIASIEAFKATMKTGFARPNLFKVFISRLKNAEQLKYQMRCFQAQLPGHNIATTDKDSGFRSIAYQKIYSDVILGFYVGQDLAELKFWRDWIDMIVNKRTNHFNYYNKYIGEIKITQINRSNQDVATWTLHDAYPKQIDPIQLDYGTNDAVMTCNTTLTYRHFTSEWHDVVKDDPKEETRYTHSVQTDMNQQDIMLEVLDKNENWKFGRGQISREEFMEMYPTWDIMSQDKKQAALKLYGLTIGEGGSMRGGARHMVVKKEEDQ